MSLLIISNEIFSVTWLAPVVRLIYEGNFKEALTLAEYYPATSGRLYAQLAAHLGRYARTLSMPELKTSKQAVEALNECEVIAKSLRTLDENEPRDFAHLVYKLSPTLLGTTFKEALKSKRLFLAHVCLISIGLLDAKDPNARSVEWLELVEACFWGEKVDLCESSLRRLFSLQYEAPVIIQLFSEAYSSRLRRQLVAAIRDKGMGLSQERSGELLVELLKNDLQFSQTDIDSVYVVSKSLQNPLRSQLESGIARQEIFRLRQTCTDLAKAEDRLAATINRVEKLASSRIDFKQLAFECRAIGDLLQTTERRRGATPVQKDVLISSIISINQSLIPFVRDLVAVDYSFHELESLLHSLERSLPRLRFEELLRLLEQPRRFLELDFPIEFFSTEWAKHLLYEPMAEVIERFQTDWLKHLLEGLTALAVNLKRIRRSLEEFADRSEDALQDPFSYQYVLEQLPEIQKQEAIVKQDFSNLIVGWNDQSLKPLLSGLVDFEGALMSYDIAPTLGLRYKSGLTDLARAGGPELTRQADEHAIAEPSFGQLVERYTKIDFPEVCTLDKKAELRIQLTRQLPVVTRILKKLRLTVSPGIKEIELNVVVTAPAFAIQKSQQSLTMPIDGDSEEIVFNLYPAERGNQVVEIEFFYDNGRIGHVLVKTRVGYWAEKKPAGIALLKDPVKSLEFGRSDKLARKLVLHVTWLSRVGELHFKVPALSANDEWVQSAPDLKSQIEDSLRELNAFLTEAVSTVAKSKPFWESICLNLKAKGAFLFDTLIHRDVAALLSRWPAHSILAISTNEQWIPWELIFDGDDFWGMKYMLTRYPRPSDHSKWPEEATEHDDSRVVQKVVNIIGGGLQVDDSKRAGQLFEGIASRVLVSELREKAVAELSIEIATADVIHCTCHGLLNPHLLHISKDSSRTQNLLPETVRVLPLQNGTLVFANACSSAAAALLFGTFNSFGWEFYLKGAEVFIGTLGAVPTKYAIEFAETIYTQLFNTQQPVSIGEALTRAREEAEKKQNIFWLLYCIYGDPDYVLKLN